MNLRILLLLLVSTCAIGQSVPNGTITQGQVWSPAQWNLAWQSKLDATIVSNTSNPLWSGDHTFSPTSGTGIIFNAQPGLPASFNGANANNGAALVLNGNFTGAGTANLLHLVDLNNTNGANILLTGNGATTPNKFIRVQNGSLQFINSAYTATLLQIADGGATSVNATAGVALTVTGNASNNVINSVNNGAGSAYSAVLNIAGTGLAVTSPAATTSNVFVLTQSGQSNWALNNAATTNVLQLSAGSGGMSWAPGGNVTVITPSSGIAVTVNGVSGQLAVVATQPVGLPNFTVSTLPTCNSTLKGGLAYVTDATTPTYNGTLTGSGTVVVPVFCNGTAWTAH